MKVAKALRNPDVNDFPAKQAMQPLGNTPSAFAAFLNRDMAIWKEVATAANFSVE
jgi:tripartite-type tricarboxylate transporter receptor subunit TctC